MTSTDHGTPSSGPLSGLKVVELAGLAPGPFAAMMLADLGAEVIRVDRVTPGEVPTVDGDVLGRGRRSIAVNTKDPAGVELVLRLVERADVFIEGFRPGVAERIGLGPEACQARNPRLVYGRMTGWGQDGPLARTAGHDINYLALAGALGQLGRAGERPHAPINLLADFGGGGMLLAFGIMAALYERERSGVGQVIDAAMVDGAAVLTTFQHGMRAAGGVPGPRGTNLLDGGAPFYDTYETADGRHVAVGALEDKFYATLLTVLGLADATDLPDRNDPAQWPALRDLLAATLRTKTRDEWAALAEGTDACLSPVLSPEEAGDHPHNAARATFTSIRAVGQPAPAPRFDRTPAAQPTAPPKIGGQTTAVLAELGLDQDEISELVSAGVIGSR